jgi:hypothetical protein
MGMAKPMAKTRISTLQAIKNRDGKKVDLTRMRLHERAIKK